MAETTETTEKAAVNEKGPMEQLMEKYSYADIEEAQATPEETPTKEEEPAAEETPTEATEATEEAKPLPSGLLDRAARVGMGPGDAAAFSSQKDLETAVRLLESTLPKQEQTQAPSEDPWEAYKVEIDKDAMTEDAIVEALNGMAKHHADQTRKVVDYVQSAMQQSQQRDQGNDAMQWFDTKISGLGPEWEATFGKGSTSSLAPGSAELANREKAMGTIGGVAQTRTDLSEDAIFNLGIGEFAPKPPAQRAAMSRPNRGVLSESGEPFSRVKEMYANMVRENGDQ